jgi:hypothetical protein
MAPSPFPARPLPRGIIIAGSVAIAFHLFALGVLVLAAPSGPWPTPIGLGSPAEPPEFSKEVSNTLLNVYLRPLHLTHNYHFESNMPERSFVHFEVKLRDADDKLIKTFKFPDENANFWVRHRQDLLAHGLGNDQPYQPPQSVRVPSPPAKAWYGETGEESKYVEKLESEWQEIRGKRGVEVFYQPTDFSLLLVKSYARYLCRTYGAATAEIVRSSREPILPVILVTRADEGSLRVMTGRSFSTFVANYGALSGR